MNWFSIVEIIYVGLLILVCLRIIYETDTSTKALAYLMLVIFLPVIGCIIYFSFGVNYRKRKIYSKKLVGDSNLAKKIGESIIKFTKQNLENNCATIGRYKELAYMLAKDNKSALTTNNDVKLLVNGENKFPDLMQALKNAKKHIHIEYYIYEDDEIGKSIEQVLMQKVKEGVVVRFIYDDFGSRSIRGNLARRLGKAGVQVYPFYKMTFLARFSRMNYRNHRKIVVVDGLIAFVGGINVSDKYVNTPGGRKKLFWRDTHMRIEGPGVFQLQYLFLCDWNFCAGDNLEPNEEFFPLRSSLPAPGNKIVQIAASGPDSDTPTILFSLLQAINLATEEILVSTPYFIPRESLLDALTVASLGGVSVKLLVPGISDSKIVNAAAHSYYGTLLNAGVEIWLYKKGFVHAKTMVIDRKMAIVGTANMDNRSFDLNFEVNALVYNDDIAKELADVFYLDVKDAEKIDGKKWGTRSWYIQLGEKTARLVSPLL